MDYELYPIEAEELCLALSLQRSITMAERDKIDDSDFAWPDAPDHPKYPIDTQAHLDAAAHLIGKAPEGMRDKIKSRAMEIAKRKGFTLPDAWKEDDKEERTAPALPQDTVFMHLPITRIDEHEWLIEGQVTSNQIDTYGTIFDYQSSKKAFEKWRGNIREMHKNEAVGRAVEWWPDDANETIFLRARISKGARDTWEKILDGTLGGFSIAVPPGKYKTRSITRNGKNIPIYYDHELAEVSVVDNWGSPNCHFNIVRADGMATDVLDLTEEESQVEPSSTLESPSSPLDRAGARMSADSRAALHEMRDKAMSLCGCDECQGMQKGDNDGDEDMERSITAIVERVLISQMQPIYARLQGIAGALARSNASPNTALDGEAITRAMESSLTTVRAELSAVKESVERIADAPMPGAPIMNAGALPPRPVDKRLPTDPQPDPYAQPRSSGSAVADAMEQLYRAGQITSFDQQMEALTAGIILQQQEKARR